MFGIFLQSRGLFLVERCTQRSGTSMHLLLLTYNLLVESRNGVSYDLMLEGEGPVV